MEFRENGVAQGALFVAAGALLGAGIGLLFAPQSGKETRRDIERFARKTGHRAERLAEEVAGTVTGAIDEAGDRAAEIMVKGKGLARDAGKGIYGVIEEGQRTIGRQKAKLARLVA